MTSLLSLVIAYVLFIQTIDNPKGSESLENLKQILEQENPTIEFNIEKEEKDFNYSILSLLDISNKRMPYINCNRKIFCSGQYDLIDLIKLEMIGNGDDSKTQLSAGYKKISYIIKIFSKIMLNNLDHDDLINDTFMYVKCKEWLDDHLVKYSKTHSVVQELPLLYKKNVFDLLLATENTLIDVLGLDLFSFVVDIKPSGVFGEIFQKVHLNIDEFKCFMSKILDIYNQIEKN